MDAEERLQGIRRELKELFIERDALVDGVLAAVLARQHVLLLGPPGTAKSMLAREVCRRLGGEGERTYFQWLLTKFTTPEEIFGPISLSELEKGRYERVIAGKLPEAHLAFLDEVFKANSAILNSLLTVLNERQFHQGTSVMDVPLQTLVAASNELPEEDELAALYDRFLLRFDVGYIEQEFRFARLLRLKMPDPKTASRLSSDDLVALQQQVEAVPVPDGVLSDIIDLRRALNAEGVVASDRRYRDALGILKAAAVLEQREEVTSAQLHWLEHVLWSDPEEKPNVVEAIAKVATGYIDEGRRLLVQAEEIYAYARRRWPDEETRGRAVLEAHTKLQEIHKRLEAMLRSASERRRDVSSLEQVITKISGMQRKMLEGSA